MLKRTLLFSAAAFVALALLSSAARAQSTPAGERKAETPAAATTTQSPAKTQAQPSPDDADLVIIANVTARELKFEVVPNPTVTFPGKPERNTLWEAERTNLPEQVQPGVTYRNIGIRLKIVSRFADIERIVAEALGEVPISETLPAPPATEKAAPPQTAPQPAAAPAQNSSPARRPNGEGKPR